MESGILIWQGKAICLTSNMLKDSKGSYPMRGKFLALELKVFH